MTIKVDVSRMCYVEESSHVASNVVMLRSQRLCSDDVGRFSSIFEDPSPSSALFGALPSLTRLKTF